LEFDVHENLQQLGRCCPMKDDNARYVESIHQHREDQESKVWVRVSVHPLVLVILDRDYATRGTDQDGTRDHLEIFLVSTYKNCVQAQSEQQVTEVKSHDPLLHTFEMLLLGGDLSIR
jgi:hypothetical protein